MEVARRLSVKVPEQTCVRPCEAATKWFSLMECCRSILDNCMQQRERDGQQYRRRASLTRRARRASVVCQSRQACRVWQGDHAPSTTRTKCAQKKHVCVHGSNSWISFWGPHKQLKGDRSKMVGERQNKKRRKMHICVLSSCDEFAFEWGYVPRVTSS
jgi:hypothetical protein